jgi:hypothetical protein
MKIGTIVAALVGGIVMFGLGGLVFGMMLNDYFRSNMVEYAGLAKDPPLLWVVFLFNLTWAALIAFVLDYAGRSGWAEGVKVGTIVMFLLSLGIDLDLFAFLNFHKSLAPMVYHILIVSLMGAVTGSVIGLIMEVFNKRTASA